MKDTHVVRTTLVGGLFVLMPIVMVVILAGKAFELAARLSSPAVRAATARLPESIATHLPLTTLLTIGFLLLVCYGLGRLVAPRRDLSEGTVLERAILFRIPGYQIVRGIATALVGLEGSRSVRPALLKREEGVQELVLVIEALPDGRRVVFLPESPAPVTGTVLIVEARLLELLPGNAVTLAQTFTRWGGGVGALIAAREATEA